MEPSTPAPRPAWWRRPLVLITAGVLVLLLVAGALTWALWPERDRRRFDEAVDNLGSARLIAYTMTLQGGLAKLDVRVTAHGDAIGTVSLLGQRLEMLRLGGRTYLKASGLLAGATGLSGLGDRWITGGTLAGGPTAQALSPAAVAEGLREALAGKTEFPRGNDGGTTINGVRVVVAHTPAGDLAVTRDSPYRVVRFTPVRGAGPSLPTLPPIPTLPPRPTRTLPPLPTLPPRSVIHGLDALETVGLAQLARTGPPGEFDQRPLSPGEIDQGFNDLRNQAKQLGNAVDTSIAFTLQGGATLSCAGGCTVFATVRGTLSPASSTVKIVNAQVVAEMTATITVEGRPAGTCVGSGPLAVAGNTVTGRLQCISPEAGTAFATAKAAKEAQLRASGRGGTAIVTAAATVQVYARATVQAEIDRQVERLQQERTAAASCTTTANCPPDRQPTQNLPGLAKPWGKAEQDRIEQHLGGNLPERYPYIDKWDQASGTGTSIKTIDWRQSTYSTSNSAITSTGRKYVDDVVNFRRNGVSPPDVPSYVPPQYYIPKDQIQRGVLYLAYPEGLSESQLRAYARVVEYGLANDVDVLLFPVQG